MHGLLWLLPQDPDYSVEMDQDNPEFKKLAFTAPGPKNAFAPLKRSDYIEKRKPSVTSSEEDGEQNTRRGCELLKSIRADMSCYAKLTPSSH